MTIGNKIAASILAGGHFSWQIYEKDGARIEWLPILLVPNIREQFLGISKEGWWVFGNDRDLRKINSLDNCFFAFPLLSLGWRNFVSNLVESIEKEKLPRHLVKTFPFDDLLIAAAQHSADSIENVFEWLNQGYPVSDAICNALESRGVTNKVLKTYREERLQKILGSDNSIEI